MRRNSHDLMYEDIVADNQLTCHVRNAVASLEAEAIDEREKASWYPASTASFRKHTARASNAQESADRLRAAFQLDEEDS